MPRPRMFRRVAFNPSVSYFKPAGIGLRHLAEVSLLHEEFEALRLCDFLGKEQKECAKEMHVSQPTFNRVLREARRKIADALTNGKAIRINLVPLPNSSFSQEPDNSES